MPFGDMLREMLEERGITQKKLAEDLHIAPSTMGNYVRNLREPDYATLKRIAAYFRVSTDMLLEYETGESVPQDGVSEAQMIRLFRRLDAETQRLLLEQGRLLMQYRAGKFRE